MADDIPGSTDHCRPPYDVSLEAAYKKFESRLADFNLNWHQVSEKRKYHPWYESNGHGQLGFCYGCDEARAGNIIKRTGLVFPNTPAKHSGYSEIVCQGCDLKLRCLKELMVPVIQHMSHEGIILWRVEIGTFNAFDYEPFKSMGNIRSFRHIPYDRTESDDYTVLLEFSDDGDTALDLVHALIAMKYSRRRIEKQHR